jgi:hypothetical protein
VDACALAMPVKGGVSGTMTAVSGGCGQLLTSLDVVTNLGAVSLNFGCLPTQTGPASLDFIAITTGIAADGGASVWRTPSGACTIAIDALTCAPNYRTGSNLMTGHGSCREPAAPQPGNTGAPITIEDFTFSVFENN